MLPSSPKIYRSHQMADMFSDFLIRQVWLGGHMKVEDGRPSKKNDPSGVGRDLCYARVAS